MKDLKMTANSNRRLLVIVLVIAVFAITVIFLAVRRPSVTAPPLPTPQASVSITEGGFVPASLTVEAGTNVVWVNADSKLHRVASNPHPEHGDHPGLDSKESIEPDSDYGFTFEEPGTYNYHDHLNPTRNGTIIVKDQSDDYTDK